MTAMSATASAFYGHLKSSIKSALRPAPIADGRIHTIVRQLRQTGYVVIPGYYTADQCATLRADIDRIIHDQPEALQKDKTGADCRIFGSERASPAIRAFHDDPFCRDVGQAYRRGPLTNFSTLAARLTAKPGNLGSGQGWHRDAFYFQYKSMIYLSDVSPDNGPFQLLPGSQRMLNVVRDTFVGRLDAPPASRITQEQVARLLARDPARAVSLPASAGTLVLFDSSTIHRGMPINVGTRYALTNYYFTPESVTPAMRAAFAPYAHG
ncbi:MAG TPA: phytanoyl-CoA dioxygenase family protein [Rhizomicrobium sp.]|nr:phytanoyl-CoA dioxygenase family protein [Rhizomicrobium sp.]